jgi:hypothetical protein
LGARRTRNRLNASNLGEQFRCGRVVVAFLAIVAKLGPSLMVDGRRVWLFSWLFACSSSSGEPPTVAPPQDAAPDVVEAGPSCAETAAGSIWAAWPMPDPAASRYDVSSPDVVVDAITKLMWQRDVALDAYAWADAKTLCDCLTTAGHDDWRLPTRIELLSIVDFTRSDPAIDVAAFTSAPSDYFWTASPVAGASDAAWYLYFFDGNTHSMGKDTAYRVRCVRTHEAAVAATPRFTDQGDGTILDETTHLAWQRDVDPSTFTWSDAKTHCASAAGGFRLPTMKELQTLIDERTMDPAIDVAAFPGAPGESFWSSTPLADTPTESWFVNFYSGVAYTSLADHTYRARCVR